VAFTQEDGRSVRLRDRTVHTGTDGLTGLPGLPTAPELLDQAGEPLTGTAQLAGRLDTATLGRGAVWLRAFEQGTRG
jgi:hypothetical protein